jgi:hypothetical protein
MSKQKEPERRKSTKTQDLSKTFVNYILGVKLRVRNKGDEAIDDGLEQLRSGRRQAGRVALPVCCHPLAQGRESRHLQRKKKKKKKKKERVSIKITVCRALALCPCLPGGHLVEARPEAKVVADRVAPVGQVGRRHQRTVRLDEVVDVSQHQPAIWRRLDGHSNHFRFFWGETSKQRRKVRKAEREKNPPQRKNGRTSARREKIESRGQEQGLAGMAKCHGRQEQGRETETAGRRSFYSYGCVI